MIDKSVEISGVQFKNPLIVGSATPTWDSTRIKRCIDGGASGAIAKSLFGNSAAIGRKYPRPRFKLFDYREYPGYPNNLAGSFTLRSLEECSSLNYEDYMVDINRAKDLVGNDGVIIASLSGSTKEEWKEMCEMVNQTKANPEWANFCRLSRQHARTYLSTIYQFDQTGNVAKRSFSGSRCVACF